MASGEVEGVKLALDETDIFGLGSTSETYERSAYDGMELQLLLITSKASQACYQKGSLCWLHRTVSQKQQRSDLNANN